eukprot:4938150-Alexandrium_andersonii.AAC.1
MAALPRHAGLHWRCTWRRGRGESPQPGVEAEAVRVVQLSPAWLPFNARLAAETTEVGFSRRQGITGEHDEVGSPSWQTTL